MDFDRKITQADLSDYFAGLALQALINNQAYEAYTPGQLANVAYQYAQAMLAARVTANATEGCGQ